jgi:hypothetical protein
MNKTLTIAAAVAALAIGTQAFAAVPTPVAGSATTAPSTAATIAPAAGSTASGQTAAPAAASTAAPAAASTMAPAASGKHAATGSHASAGSKLDAMTCADYQKRVDDAITGSKDTAKIEHAKKNRDEGAKLCSTGQHEAGVKHFRTALRDLGVSKTQ